MNVKYFCDNDVQITIDHKLQQVWIFRKNQPMEVLVIKDSTRGEK